VQHNYTLLTIIYHYRGVIYQTKLGMEEKSAPKMWKRENKIFRNISQNPPTKNMTMHATVPDSHSYFTSTGTQAVGAECQTKYIQQ
jgi:hypothetical protein